MSGSPPDTATTPTSTGAPAASPGTSTKTGSLLGAPSASSLASIPGMSGGQSSPMLLQLMQMLSRMKGG